MTTKRDRAYFESLSFNALIDEVFELETEVQDLKNEVEELESAPDPDEPEECVCEDFESECLEIWQSFYLGKEADAISKSKALVCAVTGRYL